MGPVSLFCPSARNTSPISSTVSAVSASDCVAACCRSGIWILIGGFYRSAPCLARRPVDPANGLALWFACAFTQVQGSGLQAAVGLRASPFESRIEAEASVPA